MTTIGKSKVDVKSKNVKSIDEKYFFALPNLNNEYK
jgi:hypothetical protein